MDDLDLAALFATHLPRVHALAGEGAGPPYGRYHEFGPTHVDVEMGIVLGDSTAPAIPDEGGEDRIEVSELPGGPIAVALHSGSYDGLGDAYNELHEWIHQQGRDDGPGPWESYIDDPGAVEDIADLRTELHWPLVES
jgi:effector-binding domain-containing protein